MLQYSSVQKYSSDSTQYSLGIRSNIMLTEGHDASCSHAEGKSLNMNIEIKNFS